MRVLLVLEKCFKEMQPNSRVKYVESLQTVIHNPKLREHEKEKIFDFLKSDQNTVKETESKFKQ